MSAVEAVGLAVWLIATVILAIWMGRSIMKADKGSRRRRGDGYQIDAGYAQKYTYDEEAETRQKKAIVAQWPPEGEDEDEETSS